MESNKEIYIPSDYGSTIKVEHVQKIDFVEWGKIYPSKRDIPNSSFGWLVETREKLFVKESPSIYYALDCNNQFAFAHWIYESSIFLPEYLKLKEIYTNIKLLLVEWKDYKRIVLKYYGIPLEDVVLYSDIRTDEDNICFFHEYMSLNNNVIPTTFYPAFHEFLARADSLSNEKTIPILYLPRGTKENFAPNDRRYDIQQQLQEVIQNLGGTVYKTDTTTDFLEQLQVVRRAKVILLDYGSSLYVNGMVTKDTRIIYLSMGSRQYDQFPTYAFLWHTLHGRNAIEPVYSYGSSKDQTGLDVCHFSITDVINTIKKYLNK